MVGTLDLQVDLKARPRERDRVRIGELVTLLGVEAHVLRHWEDEGLLHPDRGVNGYRTYGEEQVTRARIVVGCRRAGLSIPAIRSLLHRDWPGREAEDSRDRVPRTGTGADSDFSATRDRVSTPADAPLRRLQWLRGLQVTAPHPSEEFALGAR